MRATWPVSMPRPAWRDRPSDPAGAHRRRHERVAPRRATREVDAGGAPGEAREVADVGDADPTRFRRFASAAGAARLPGPGPALPTKGRRRRPPSGLPRTPTSASRRCSSPRSCCARKGSPTSATCRRQEASPSAAARARRDRLRRRFAGIGRLPPGCRRADHRAGGRAFRLLRAVRARAHPHHQRPERQEGRHPELGSSAHLLPVDHGGPRRARPQQGHRLGRRAPTVNADGAVRGGRSTPSSAFRPSRRSCAPARSAM